MDMLITAWTERDAAAAASFVESLADESLRSQLRSEMFSELNARDPKLAKTLVLRLPAGPQRVREIGETIAAMFERDPDEAIIFYDGLSDEDKRGNFGGFVKAWKQGAATEAAEALIEATPLRGDDLRDAHEARGSDLKDTLKPWIERDPRVTGEMALHLPEVERADVLYATAEEWCRRDAPAAGAWAAALPAGPARDEAMKQFTYEWAQHDASQVTEWINTLPTDSGKAAAAEGFAFSIFDTDPDGALAWTRVIPDDGRRLKVLRNAWRKWRSKNSTGANDWIENATGLSEPERAALKGANDE
jgi:hypothetical protein